jgi:hypothetical protein
MKKVIVKAVVIACFASIALSVNAENKCDEGGGYARYTVPFANKKGIFVTGVKQSAAGYLEVFLQGKAFVAGKECSSIRFEFCSGTNFTPEMQRNLQSILLTALTTGLPIRANIIGIDTSADRCYANTVEIVRNPEE